MKARQIINQFMAIGSFTELAEITEKNLKLINSDPLLRASMRSAHRRIKTVRDNKNKNYPLTLKN